jgi:hypothetical protein
VLLELLRHLVCGMHSVAEVDVSADTVHGSMRTWVGKSVRVCVCGARSVPQKNSSQKARSFQIS